MASINNNAFKFQVNMIFRACDIGLSGLIRSVVDATNVPGYIFVLVFPI